MSVTIYKSLMLNEKTVLPGMFNTMINYYKCNKLCWTN